MSRQPTEPDRRITTRLPESDETLIAAVSQLRAELDREILSVSVVDRLLKTRDDGSSPGEPLAPSSGEKYAVTNEVGRGGMGKILKVRDNDLNREVAMKVLLSEETGEGPAGLRRFIEEAQITGQLEHPNVLPVHDFGLNPEGELFFTMQLVPGSTTLREVIEQLKSGDLAAHEEYTWERRVQIIQQVCYALNYAHRRGVVHRDVKPDNILIGAHGEVFLVDWGVAKVVAQPAGEAPEGPLPVATLTPEGARETQQGAWVGTPLYMAPEQIMGKPEEISAQTDVYGLSAVLYELLCLRHYLDGVGSSLSELVGWIVQRKPKDAESWVHPVGGRVPRQLSRICRKGLSKQRDARFASCNELAKALQLWLEGRAPIVCPGTFLQRTLSVWSDWIDRHPTAVPALSIVLLGALFSMACLGLVFSYRALST